MERGVITFSALLVLLLRCSAVPNTTLELVQVVFRHGDRTPESSYANDPHKDDKYYPYGLGQLTRMGRHTEHELGKFLRLRYNNTLGPDYYRNYVKTYVSYSERCQESVGLVLAGLWPASTILEWDDQGLGTMWLPIPYKVVPAESDYMLGSFGDCKRRDLDIQEYLQSPDFQDKIVKSLGGQNVLNYITENSGSDLLSENGFCNFLSTLKCQKDLGMALPDWTNSLNRTDLENACLASLTIFTHTRTISRLSFGQLPQAILTNFDNFINNGLGGRRIILYSAHDITVLVIMHMLRITSVYSLLPDYGASFMIELHRDEMGQRGLKFFYRESTKVNPTQVIPEGCTDFCPVEKVKELLSDVIPVDIDEECWNHAPNMTDVHPRPPTLDILKDDDD